MKNIPNKEFQHWMESKLIEVMKMKMQMIQFVSIVNWIQTKLRKVIYNMKNMWNKEFQHWMESQLIEVMKMKMHLTQFASSVNQIQISRSNPAGSV
jgi:CRISPR/Cas system CSM-associated protein Csm2 small subunit